MCSFANQGPFSLSLEPGLLLALYPGRDPYLSLWGSLRAAFREGEARAEAQTVEE
jgi:hypothetical protein